MKKLIPALVLTVAVSHALCALDLAAPTNSAAGSSATKPAAVVEKKGHGHAAPKSAPSSAPGKKAKHARHSFHGVVKSTDTRAMTLTLDDKGETHVLGLDGESRLMKDGQPVPLAGIAAGDHAAGVKRESKDGGSTIVNASFGQKPIAEAKPKAKGASPASKGHGKSAKAAKAAKPAKESEAPAAAKPVDVPAVVPGVTPLPVVPPAQ